MSCTVLQKNIYYTKSKYFVLPRLDAVLQGNKKRNGKKKKHIRTCHVQILTQDKTTAVTAAAPQKHRKQNHINTTFRPRNSAPTLTNSGDFLSTYHMVLVRYTPAAAGSWGGPPNGSPSKPCRPQACPTTRAGRSLAARSARFVCST